MLGFIIGTVCLIGLVKVLRRSGHWAGYGYGGCNDGFRGYGWRRGLRGPRSWLSVIFERMHTTPDQEKVILSALDELRDNRNAIYQEMRQTRADIAQAVSIGIVDDATLDETFARHDRLLAQLRVSFVETVKKITETLDEHQRKQITAVLESARRSWGPRWEGSPYHVWV